MTPPLPVVDSIVTAKEAVKLAHSRLQLRLRKFAVLAQDLLDFAPQNVGARQLIGVKAVAKGIPADGVSHARILLVHTRVLNVRLTGFMYFSPGLRRIREISRILALFGASAIAIVACERDVTPLPGPGRYFYRSGEEPCGAFEIDGEGALSDTAFCPGQAQIRPHLWASPTLACGDDIELGITPTLDGFALTRDGQVAVFVFSSLGACRSGLPPTPPAPTL